MQSEVPKPLTLLKGKTFLHWILASVTTSGIGTETVIVASPTNVEALRPAAPVGTRFVLQVEQLGTGHAVACVKDAVGAAPHILVLYGDSPTTPPEVLKQIFKVHVDTKAAVTFMSAAPADFNEWRKVFYDFGRVKRDASGEVSGIIERRMASPEELEIREVNAGIYCFRADWLWKNISKLTTQNAQKEYYLTDLIKIALSEGDTVIAVPVAPEFCLGVNTKEQLELCETIIK